MSQYDLFDSLATWLGPVPCILLLSLSPRPGHCRADAEVYFSVETWFSSSISSRRLLLSTPWRLHTCVSSFTICNLRVIFNNYLVPRNTFCVHDCINPQRLEKKDFIYSIGHTQLDLLLHLFVVYRFFIFILPSCEQGFRHKVFCLLSPKGKRGMEMVSV